MGMTLGEKVRILRENKGINQTELGKQTGMTQRKISYIECGKYEPSKARAFVFQIPDIV